MSFERRNSIWRAYRNPLLWTLQGWIAMFYGAAGYAKLTEEPDLISFMLKWPRYADPAAVRLIGVAEIAIALGVLFPLFSWRLGAPVLMMSLWLLGLEALAMAAFHAIIGDILFAGVNVFLFLLCFVTLGGRMSEFIGPPQVSR